GFQLGLFPRVVQQLDDWKPELDLAIPHLVAEPVRPPVCVLVGQYGKADHLSIIPIEQPRVVAVHAQAEALLLAPVRHTLLLLSRRSVTGADRIPRGTMRYGPARHPARAGHRPAAKQESDP